MKLNKLNESIFFKGEIKPYKQNAVDAVIHINPTINELKILLNKDDVRGLWDSENEDLFFWNASELNHNQIQNEFDIDGYPFILTQNNYILMSDWMLHPDDYYDESEDGYQQLLNAKETIINLPFIKYIYPNGFSLGESY